MARWLLILLVAGTLFPAAWLRDFSPTYRRVFDALFHPVWVHVLLHTLTFAGLVFLFYAIVPSTRKFWRMLILVLIIAVLQEGFQAITSTLFYPGGVLFDLGVDLFGAGIGWLGAIFWVRGWRARNRERKRHPGS
jgi:hypothetical protein